MLSTTIQRRPAFTFCQVLDQQSHVLLTGMLTVNPADAKLEWCKAFLSEEKQFLCVSKLLITARL